MNEEKLYTVDELARLTGLDIEDVWQRLEAGKLSALAYADGGDTGWFGWRVIPPEGVKAARAGTRDLIKWQSATGRLIAKCDAGGIRVRLLDVDIQALRQPRERIYGLRAAVISCWNAGLPVEAPVSVVMAFLNEHDPSGRIRRVADGVVVWLDDQDAEHETKKKTLTNSLKGWREHYRRRPQAVA